MAIETPVANTSSSEATPERVALRRIFIAEVI
jgi:hypothetical protein